MKKIAVEVYEGLVVRIASNVPLPEIEVEVFDHDSAEDDESDVEKFDEDEIKRDFPYELY